MRCIDCFRSLRVKFSARLGDHVFEAVLNGEAGVNRLLVGLLELLSDAEAVYGWLRLLGSQLVSLGIVEIFDTLETIGGTPGQDRVEGAHVVVDLLEVLETHW